MELLPFAALPTELFMLAFGLPIPLLNKNRGGRPGSSVLQRVQAFERHKQLTNACVLREATEKAAVEWARQAQEIKKLRNTHAAPHKIAAAEAELRRMRSSISIEKPPAGVLKKMDRIVAKEFGFSQSTMERIRADPVLQEICTKDAWKTPDFVIDGAQQWWARQLFNERVSPERRAKNEVIGFDVVKGKIRPRSLGSVEVIQGPAPACRPIAVTAYQTKNRKLEAKFLTLWRRSRAADAKLRVKLRSKLTAMWLRNAVEIRKRAIRTTWRWHGPIGPTRAQ